MIAGPSPDSWSGRAEAGPTPAPESDLAGTRVLDGKYRLDARLGEGASGIVYRTTHLGLGKAFALKLLKPDPALDPFAVARFRREAEALGRLGHPHIVAVTDAGLDAESGAPYLVMELLEGVSLAQLCAEGGPLPLDRALPILEAIAGAIDAAHERGILHRDLKPANVLLGRGERGEEVVKVLDFGLAGIAGARPLADTQETPAPAVQIGGPGSERLTGEGDLVGTPLYVAPEVIRHAGASRASDLYSLAVIAYEMLAGRPPFEGLPAEILAGHVAGEPAPPPGLLSSEVLSVLRQGLAKDPALRPATAHELVRALRDAAYRENLARWRRRETPRRILLSVGIAASVLFAGLLLPSSGLPVLERWAYDLRLRAAPDRPPDPRIVLVTFDEASLAASRNPLASRADEIGRVLDGVFAAGARGVAIDMLLPPSWSSSPGFSDLVLRHPQALTLAAYSASKDRVDGTGSVAGLTTAALGPREAGALFGFVNLDEDPDKIVRRGRLRFRNGEGGTSPSWAARAASSLSPLPTTPEGEKFWIDHRIDSMRYARLSWSEVPTALERRPGIFRDRLLLVGGDLAGDGDDLHDIPVRRSREGTISGLALQALLVDTILSGLPVREAPRAPFLAAAALWAGLAAAVSLFARRPLPFLAILVATLLLYFGLSVLAFQRSGLLWPATIPLLPTLAALALALLSWWILPSRLSRSPRP